jgi:hypothetical protein
MIMVYDYYYSKELCLRDIDIQYSIFTGKKMIQCLWSLLQNNLVHESKNRYERRMAVKFLTVEAT